MASNYLDINSLLELSCAKVASLIKGKSIEEIRKFFNIVNDFSPEEEQLMIDENKWAEQSFWEYLSFSIRQDQFLFPAFQRLVWTEVIC